MMLFIHKGTKSIRKPKATTMSTNTNTNENDIIAIQDLSQDLLEEVVSHFTLIDLDLNIRKVSRIFHSVCDNRKQMIFNRLKDGCMVEVIGLGRDEDADADADAAVADTTGVDDDADTTPTSTTTGWSGSGTDLKKLNGQIGYCNDGILAAFDQVSGIGYRIRVEPKYLNPYLLKERTIAENDRIRHLTSKLDGPVDIVFSFVMHNLRIAAGLETTRTVIGSDEEIMDVASALIPEDGSWQGQGNQIFNAFDEKLAIFSRENLCKRMDVGTRFHPDGPNGKILRDFVRFMKSWEQEKIDLTLYYYAKRERSGVVLVGVTQWGLTSVCVAKETSYLAPGITAPSPGVMAMGMLVPIYDYFVCSHLHELNGFGIVNGLDVLSEHHIRDKIISGEVKYCGESASVGLWESE